MMGEEDIASLQAEIAKLHSRLGHLMANELEKKKELNADYRKLLKEELGPYRVEIDKTRRQREDAIDRMANLTEVRDVECEERFDYDSGVIIEVRLDTRDVIDRRPMSADERQLEAFSES